MKDFNVTAWLARIGAFLLGVLLGVLVFTGLGAVIALCREETNESPREITPVQLLFHDDIHVENIVVEGHTYLVFRINRGGNAVHSPNCTCFKKLEKENLNANIDILSRLKPARFLESSGSCHHLHKRGSGLT